MAIHIPRFCLPSSLCSLESVPSTQIQLSGIFTVCPKQRKTKATPPSGGREDADSSGAPAVVHSSKGGFGKKSVSGAPAAQGHPVHLAKFQSLNSILSTAKYVRSLQPYFVVWL